MPKPYKKLQSVKYKNQFFLQFANTFYPVLVFLNQEYGIGHIFGMAETFDRLYNHDKKVQSELEQTMNNHWRGAPAYPLFVRRRCAFPLMYQYMQVAIELYISGNVSRDCPAMETITPLLNMLHEVERRGPVTYLPIFSIVDNHIRYNETIGCQKEYGAQFSIMRFSRFSDIAGRYIKFLNTYQFANTPDRIIIEKSLTCYYYWYCALKGKAGIGTRIINLFNY